MSGTLIAHVDSGKVPYEKLGEYPVRGGIRRWKPIAHLELVDALKNQINCNYRIARQEYAVSNNGFKLFGVLDKKQAEIIGEELFKISEELKPQPSQYRKTHR